MSWWGLLNSWQFCFCFLKALAAYWFSQSFRSRWFFSRFWLFFGFSLQVTLRQLSHAHGMKADNRGKVMSHTDKEHSGRFPECRNLGKLRSHSPLFCFCFFWGSFSILGHTTMPCLFPHKVAVDDSCARWLRTRTPVVVTCHNRRYHSSPPLRATRGATENNALYWLQCSFFT